MKIQQNQLFATRLFIVLFLISLISLVGYASLTLRLINVQIKNPAQSTFVTLYVDYPDTLVCPCSQALIELNKFVNVNISYHQVCISKYLFCLSEIKSLIFIDLFEYIHHNYNYLHHNVVCLKLLSLKHSMFSCQINYSFQK